jgi:para-aminobenzoate synthetase
MRLLVVDNGSSSHEPLMRRLQPHDIVTCTPETIPEGEALADGIILSGGHRAPVAWDHGLYDRELDLVRRSTLPILGICLGCQILARAWGSPLRQLDVARAGVIPVHVTRDSAILPRHSDVAGVFEHHHWVIETLMSPLVALASSADGLEAIAHEQRPQYGVQFHPERCPEASSGWEVIDRFLRECERIRHDRATSDGA